MQAGSVIQAEVESSRRGARSLPGSGMPSTAGSQEPIPRRRTPRRSPRAGPAPQRTPPTLPTPERRSRASPSDGPTPQAGGSRSGGSSSTAWDPRMGPAPGIRWKSGAPPQPPKYTADAKDVGSFDRFCRRVRLWAKRAAGWMTDGEAALLLVESLSGAPERELEFTPLEKIEKGGVEFVLQQLETSANEHLVYRKHHYLRSWETVRRHGGETMRAYIHRFDQLHKQLSHVDVDVQAMYSGEALGHRLLERAGLTSEQGRMVLIGSSQSFQYASIRDSLLLQYPDTLPIPAIGSGPGKGKSKGDKGKGRKQVHVTSHEEGASPQQEGDGDKELAEARRWTDGKGGNKDGSKGSAPSAQGKAGPGKGAPSPSKGKGEQKGKGPSLVNVCETGPGEDYPTQDDEHQYGYYEDYAEEGGDEEAGEDQEEGNESYFVFMTAWDTPVPPQISQVLAVKPESAAGLMVIDTACQKTCIGRRAYLAHCAVLRPFGLQCQWTPENEFFRFGAGDRQESTMLTAIPAGIKGNALVILASLLEVNIPLLASLRLLDQLGAVLDLSQQRCHLRALGVEVQLVKTLGGHLAIRVTDFPDTGMPRSADTWHRSKKPGADAVLDPSKNKSRFSQLPPPESTEGTSTRHVHTAAGQGSSNRPCCAPLNQHAGWSRRPGSSAMIMACQLEGDGCGDDVTPPSFPEHSDEVPPPPSGTGREHHPQRCGSRADPGDMPSSVEPGRPVWESPRSVCEVRDVRRPLALGRGRSWMAVLVSLLALFVASTDEGNHDPGWNRQQGQSQGEGQSNEYVDPGLLAWPPDSTGAERVRSGKCHEPDPGGSRRSKRDLRLGERGSPGDRQLILKTGQRKRLAAQAKRAHRVLALECDVLRVGLEDAASARKAVTYGADLLQMTPCEKQFKLEAAGSPLVNNTATRTSYKPSRGRSNRSSPLLGGRRPKRPLLLEGRWSENRSRSDMDHVSTRPVEKEVYYLDYNQDIQEWREVMKQVDSVFRTSATQQITLSENHEIRKSVERLVPWKVGRVQIVKTPRARRMPTDVPYTHRANVLLYNDDTLVCESEDDPDEPAVPAEEATQEEEVPPDEVRGAGITFPSWQVHRDVKRAVARLHVNLGHPSTADLVRMLSHQGTVTPEAIQAAKCLSCTSCLRMKGNAPPRPSRTLTRYVGQLNDNVLMDIFYARTIDSVNHVMLGMVDEATNLQQVAVVDSREPEAILKAFRLTWCRPFGQPYKITVDQDGASMGDFWCHMVDMATEVDYVPPEPHHRLGKAERCNAVYREMLNKVVDAMAVVNKEDLNRAVDATVPPEEHNRRTIMFRAEAQKAAAPVNVDQHVRRALLRKTAHMRVEDASPGAKCAVRRSQLRGKGPRKRGGYVIGRLATFDSSCAWVQLGPHTVRVDPNQLRPAYGFGSWSTTDDDIQALKDAEKNMFAGEVHSLEDAPSPADEPLELNIAFPGTAPEEIPVSDTPMASAPGTPAPPSARLASPRGRGPKRPASAPAGNRPKKTSEDQEERTHALHRMCFLHYGQDGVVDCIALVYVDDLLVTYAETFDLGTITGLFRYRSQEGILVCMTTKAALDGNAPAVLLDWKGTRTPRVVRSTLAGEAYAADDAIDRGVFANQMFSQIIFGAEANPLTNLKTLRHCHATDCKSLYDAAIAANFNTEEKRAGLAIRAAQETIPPSDMRWVPTTAMWADGLTKADDGLRSVFLDWLRNPTVQLRSEV
eukprot:s1320_g19.t1